ncbi:LysR family transcriptional regulator [Acidovorax sp. Root275]|uniref:LysR family transcriptional regulator n=1 Tax=Acidovorax sp. Root275 TaxID=1736508 RepID=UPI00070AD1D3|nr:LysR family transcriptional regulator [Acidovorax sp. Root275]KRD42029.1 LysR family transcriptional regulator [Acidovorax sp. Root275]
MSLPHFTPRQLEAFVTVAELRSFAATADRVALTPSAVSQLVSELEDALGFKLFERSTRRVDITSAGREFLASAESVLKHLRMAQMAASDVRNRAAGIVRIAAPLVVASVILPKAIKAYVQKRPKVRIHIRDVPVEKLVDAVASGDADLALGPDRACGDDVTRIQLFESPWVLWCAPTHPLAHKRSVTWDQLHAYPLVAAGRDHERSVAQMHTGLPSGQRVTPVEIVDNISTAMGLAAADVAATLAPDYVGALAKPLGLVRRRILSPEVMRYVCLYSPARRATSPAAEGFSDHLIQTLAKSK